MKKIIIPVRLPDLINIDIDCVAGIPKQVILAYEEVASRIVSAENAGKPAFREVMNVLFECTIEQAETTQKRSFVIAKHGEVVEAENVSYIGSAPSAQTGKLLHVFETTKE